MKILSDMRLSRSSGAALGLVALLLLAACENSSNPGDDNRLQSGVAPERTVSPLPGALEPAPADAAVSAAPVEPAPVEPVISPVMKSGESLAMPGSITEAKVRVGALLPLSGGRAELGRSLLDGALLAVNDVADENFVLLPFDTKGTAEGAAIAARDALDSKVDLILGPLFSASVTAAASAATSAGVNVIAFSNNRVVAEPGVFLTGLLPEAQIDRVVRYAAGRGIRRIGALLPSGRFGDRVESALRQTATVLGIELVRVEYFDSDPNRTADAVRIIGDYDQRRASLKAQIKALEGATDEVSRRTLARLEKLETYGPLPFEALVVAASGTKLTEVAAQLGNYDIDTKSVRLLGLSSWGAPGVGREPALQGAWFANAPGAAGADFRRSFAAMYERTPHPLSVSAYDVTALAAILASSAGEGRFDAAVLTNENGFAGSGGLFRFLPNGLSERALEIREITQDGSKLTDPAPESFIIPLN